MRPRLQWMTLFLAACNVVSPQGLVGEVDAGAAHDAGSPPVNSGNAAPRFVSTDPIAIPAGGERAISLGALVADADDPLSALTFQATGSANVAASVLGETLTLRAAAGFEGRESIGLTVSDPAGHRASARVVVIVGSPPPAARSCTTDLVVRASGSPSQVAVRGDWNGWREAGDALARRGDEWARALDLAPGDYAYEIVVDGVASRDAANPRSVFVGAEEKSRLTVSDCDRPLLSDATREQLAAGDTLVRFRVWDAAARAGIDNAATRARVAAGPNVAIQTMLAGDELTVKIAPFTGKALIRASVADRRGVRSDDAVVAIWGNGGAPAPAFSFANATLYFALVDRFANGDQANDDPLQGIDSRANFSGGDLAGLMAKVEAGYFDDLGVNAIWIPFAGAAPVRAYTGEDGRLYAGYHGYWPRSWTDVEARLGGATALTALVEAAHRRGIRVVMDLVANHVSNEHPIYATHRTDGWFHPMCVCGEAGCGWDAHVFDCWFRPFTPDFDFRQTAAMDAVVKVAVDWATTYNLDGFRVDAVKHLRPHFVRELRFALDQTFRSPSEPLFLIGETFAGRFSEGGRDALREYVGATTLHGQFDFPLYWEVIRTLARGEGGGLGDLERVVEASKGAYGDAAVMSPFLGNHDVPRFLSHAAGQIADMWGNGAKAQAWSAPPAQPTASEPYDCLMLAWTFVLSQPGVPLIYYGDEIGLAGAGDPDNRRMMVFGGDVSDQGRRVLAHVKRVGGARRALSGLRSRDTATLLVDATAYVYTRGTGDDTVLVALNAGATERALSVDVAAFRARPLVDHVSGATVPANAGRVTFTLGARSSRIFALR